MEPEQEIQQPLPRSQPQGGGFVGWIDTHPIYFVGGAIVAALAIGAFILNRKANTGTTAASTAAATTPVLDVRPATDSFYSYNFVEDANNNTVTNSYNNPVTNTTTTNTNTTVTNNPPPTTQPPPSPPDQTPHQPVTDVKGLYYAAPSYGGYDFTGGTPLGSTGGWYTLDGLYYPMGATPTIVDPTHKYVEDSNGNLVGPGDPGYAEAYAAYVAGSAVAPNYTEPSLGWTEIYGNPSMPDLSTPVPGTYAGNAAKLLDSAYYYNPQYFDLAGGAIGQSDANTGYYTAAKNYLQNYLNSLTS
jgi:hypothetical protein